MKKRYFAVSALFASGVVLACELITVPPPPAPVTIRLGQTAQQAIGDVLQSMYGDRFNSDEVFVAAVAIRTPLGGAAIVPFTKPCGENFRGEGSSDGGGEGGGGGTGGSSSGSGGGYVGPGGCVLGCETGTVTVGGIMPT